MSDWPEGWDRPPDVPPRAPELQPQQPRTTVLPAHLDPRAPAPPPRPTARPRRSPRLPRVRVLRWVRPRRVLALVVLVVVLLAANLVAVGVWTATHLQHLDALPPAAGRPHDGSDSVWLLVGSDSRSSLTRAQRAALHTGTAEGQRTDTILLLAVPRTGKPVLVSLPRDSWVTIPGHGKDKLNAAYAYGGAQLLVRTVEGATGVHVDHVAEVGFLGIVDLTDAVGGVPVCVPRAMQDAKSGLDVAKGCQTFDGKTALAYVRARYSDPKGDLGRVERQRAYLRALLGKAVSWSLLLRPDRQWRLARGGTSAVAVDGAGPVELARLVRAVRQVGGPGTEATVPVSTTALRTSRGVAVAWDAAAAKALFAQLAR
ncbi:LytR family transcriptional attenuator [Motilibacter rhizosphaerae]|uniref:LytR family transcriptional attenuator n=1 Tax=Motilibacter rhizosphaerae TaxID=598652 RepID=A0A4Q7NSV2_9ACTN|nr:LCP family protein [Motilibacter rhizosphaerae]RZS90223.1 LytR family transcriptional attenuator [Motilibacter rhizosphaerae]